MKEKILNYVQLLTTKQSDRDKKFREFMKTYKWILLNIPEEIRKNFPQLAGIVTNSQQFKNYKVDFNFQDYIWWLKQYKDHPEINIRSNASKELELYVLARMSELNVEQLLDSKEALEDTIEKITEIYNC